MISEPLALSTETLYLLSQAELVDSHPPGSSAADAVHGRVPPSLFHSPTDPLTGRTVRIRHFRGLQWELPDLEALVAGTDSTCPFCEDRVLQVTPCFLRELIPEGRKQKGDRVLFPNLMRIQPAPGDAGRGGRAEPLQRDRVHGVSRGDQRAVEEGVRITDPARALRIRGLPAARPD